MIQPQTQTQDYWVSQFTLAETDIEFLYSYFLETERPLKTEEMAYAIMDNRVTQEIHEVKRRLAGRTVYQPQKSYQVGDKLIFPALKFATGEVAATRSGYNPEQGDFTVITIDIGGKPREFAANLSGNHILNEENEDLFVDLDSVDTQLLFDEYGSLVIGKLTVSLIKNPEFVRLGSLWLIKGLLTDINIGHLHLTEAILEMSNGGPLPSDQILAVLDLDPSIKPEVQTFSLNYALLQDDRFDEVAPKGKIAWFLRRMEPEGVREAPPRLVYKPIPYDRALLSPQLLMLERELDDEWSDVEPATIMPPAVRLVLTYPHRVCGTLPVNAGTRPLLPLGLSPRHSIQLIDAQNGQTINAWVVQSGRYIYGLYDWYELHKLPVGGYLTLRPAHEPGSLLLDYDRRSERREWVRLATVIDNQLKFDLQRRSIGCHYDDLMIVGTDYSAAVDAMWRRVDTTQRQLSSLLAEIVPELARMNPQNTAHAKTIYSAINMVRRVPPAPIFAELVRHPAFRAMGDHYWQFDPTRWQRR